MCGRLVYDDMLPKLPNETIELMVRGKDIRKLKHRLLGFHYIFCTVF